MKDQVTSIEQSKQLIGMGVPAEKASMIYQSHFTQGVPKLYAQPYQRNGYPPKEKIREDVVPAFTVADLLGLLPPKISWQDPSDGNFRMRRYMGENGIEWVVDYDRFIANDVSIINVLVEAIILLVSTKHELNI
ncbi:hypothetical protein [Alistipes onderdonkii]|uniref:hypothetical protein n=1 Tax=Alistipes onderdonkii TaxID=328813 RepID=UPI0018763A33|nr:hypothetical protein [Alistipes onderdonkii]MBE5048006.1 hypothetical protein [Alistipes onderdonkii]